MLLYSVADLGGSAQNVLIVHCAPSRSTLGSLQGLHQAIFSLCRALAPFGAASLFSVCVANGVGAIAWAVYACFGLAMAVSAYRLRAPAPADSAL